MRRHDVAERHGRLERELIEERAAALRRISQMLESLIELVIEERPGSSNLSRLTLEKKGTLTPLLQEPAFSERNAALSPDGRWLAYESDESGTPEVYVRPFPDVNGGRWQVSSGGGRYPVWHPAVTGRELFYVSPKGMMAMAFTVTSTFVPGASTLLFDTAAYTVNLANRRLAVSGDGRRFLLLKNATTAAAGGTVPRLLFVENWFEELKQRVPVP